MITMQRIMFYCAVSYAKRFAQSLQFPEHVRKEVVFSENSNETSACE